MAAVCDNRFYLPFHMACSTFHISSSLLMPSLSFIFRWHRCPRLPFLSHYDHYPVLLVFGLFFFSFLFFTNSFFIILHRSGFPSVIITLLGSLCPIFIIMVKFQLALAFFSFVCWIFRYLWIFCPPINIHTQFFTYWLVNFWFVLNIIFFEGGREPIQWHFHNNVLTFFFWCKLLWTPIYNWK